MTDEQTLTAAGFKIVTRAEFDAATDVPDGIRELAAAVIKQWGGAFVVYDPGDDKDGWLLIGDDRAELAAETVQYRCEQIREPTLF
jgi:hypothetical protein